MSRCTWQVRDGRWEGQKAEEGLREKLSCRREMSGWTGRRQGPMLLLGDHPGWLPGASPVCAVHRWWMSRDHDGVSNLSWPRKDRRSRERDGESVRQEEYAACRPANKPNFEPHKPHQQGKANPLLLVSTVLLCAGP